MNTPEPINWRRYLDAYWGISLVSEAPAWREYRIDNPSRSMICRSMLMRYEFAVLYALARDHYRGKGCIIDAGPLTGVTSNAFSKGALANQFVAGRTRRIFAFDLFDHIPAQETLDLVPNRNGSILDTFLEVNLDYLDMISVIPGNLLDHPWNSGLIEIALIDLSKSWELNEFIVNEWFPNLIPDGIVIQQDYCSYFSYWIPITMQYLKRNFQFLDYCMGGSTLFRCIEVVQRGVGSIIRRLSFEEQEELLHGAVATAPEPVKPLILCSLGCFYVAYNQPEKVRRILSMVNRQQISSDPATDFHGVVSGSADAIAFLNDLPRDQLSAYGIVAIR